MSLQTTILNLMEMAAKFLRRIENTVGKGEIARYYHFLLFPYVFKRLVQQTRKNQGLFGKGLNRSFSLAEKTLHCKMKKKFSYNLENVDSRSGIRLHVLCSLILIYNVHKASCVIISKEKVKEGKGKCRQEIHGFIKITLVNGT